MLSALLAERCDSVLGLDLSRTAVDRARTRASDAGLTNVEFREGAFLERVGPSDAPFDLLCLVEIGYYSSEPQVREMLRWVDGLLDRSATILAAHWTGSSDDHVISGDQVHDVLVDELADLGFRHEDRQRPPGFDLDRWERS